MWHFDFRYITSILNPLPALAALETNSALTTLVGVDIENGFFFSPQILQHDVHLVYSEMTDYNRLKVKNA